MNEQMDPLATIIEAIKESKSEEGLVDNLCNIVGIMMMRAGVEEMRFTQDELQLMTKTYDGKGIDFGTEGTDFVVKIGTTSEEQPEGTHFLN